MAFGTSELVGSWSKQVHTMFENVMKTRTMNVVTVAISHCCTG